jgi:hypothetical protein
MKRVVTFYRDLHKAYDRKRPNKLAGFPVFFLFILFPLLVVITIITWFDLRMLIGTIIVLIIGIVGSKLVIHHHKRKSRLQIHKI